MTPEAEARVTRYEVSCVPEENINARHFTITVERRARDQWAVLEGGFCLGCDGVWDYEPIPSERTDAWKLSHRFDVDTAMRLAKEAAPHLTCNGHTVADVLKLSPS